MDRKKLENWLMTRSREDAVLIAQRAAVRVFPMSGVRLSDPLAFKRGWSTLAILRPLLTAGVARYSPTSEVKSAATAAAFSDEAIAFPGAAPARAAARVAAAPADRDPAAVYAAAAATTRSAASTDDAYSACVMEVDRDVAALAADQDLASMPVWHGPIPKELRLAEATILAVMAREYGSTTSFWHRWWEGARTGNWLDWELQREIALIPDEVWKVGPKAVIAEIDQIEARYATTTSLPGPPDLGQLVLAHGDFTFDVGRRLMKMVPFESDVSRLSDPEALKRLLHDSDDFRSILETLVRAAEASGRQSATELKVYASEILAELDRASKHNELRVGVLIDLGEALQDFSADENIRMGLGATLPRQLNRAVDRLLALLRDYFAPAYARIGPLRSITLGQGEDPRAILEKAAENLRAVRSNDGSGVIPLAEEDIAVLERLLDELRRAARGYDQATIPEVKQELEQEFARKAAQFGYDAALYVKRGVDAVEGALGGKDNDIADTLLRRIHLAQTAGDIMVAVWEFVRHFLPLL